MPSRNHVRVLLAMTIALGASLIVFRVVYFSQRDRAADTVARMTVADWITADREQLEAALESFQTRSQRQKALLLRGVVALRSGDVERAAEIFQQASVVPATRTSALELLGRTYYAQGRHLEAINLFRTLLEGSPQHLDARRMLAASLYDLGAMDPAMEQLALVAQQDPSDPRPHRLQGLIQKDFEQYSAAVEDYRESLRRDPHQPDDAQIRRELAECLVRIHQYDEALKMLSGLDESAKGCALAAECELALGHAERAASLAASAVQQDPTQVDALLMKSRLLEEAGDLEAAGKTLQQAVAAQPGEFEPRYQLTNILRRLGRSEDAERELHEFERLQEMRNEFARLHETAFLDLENADLRYQIGEIAYRLYKFDLAETWYAAALAIDRNHNDARRALAALRSTQPPVPSQVPSDGNGSFDE